MAGGVPAPSGEALEQLRREFPESPFTTFTTWDDAHHWLDAVGIRSETADAVLRPLLKAYKRNLHAASYGAMLFMLWPHLNRVASRMQWIDQDANALDSQISWALLHVLGRIDVVGRPERLGQKIINDTLHDVRQHYAQERASATRHIQLFTDHAEGHDACEGAGVPDPGVDDDEFARVDFRHDRDWACAYIEDIARRRLIPWGGAKVLIGCVLYDYSIQEMADRLGLSYEAAKQGRLRTEKYLRTKLKFLSLRLPDTPLKMLGPERRKGGSDD